MVKLSQQLEGQRETRTERVLEKQKLQPITSTIPLTQQEIEERSQIELDRQIKENVTKSEEKLKYYREAYQRASERNDASAQDRYIEYINAWQQGVQQAKAGYTFESVSQWASQTASGEVSRALAKDEAREEYQQRLRDAKVYTISGVWGSGDKTVGGFEEKIYVDKEGRVIQTDIDAYGKLYSSPRTSDIASYYGTPLGTILTPPSSTEPTIQTQSQEVKKVVQVEKQAIIDDRKWYDKSLQEVFIIPAKERVSGGARYVWTGVKGAYEKIPLGRWYYNPQIMGVSAIAPYKTSEKSIDLTTGVERGQEYLGKVSEDVRTWAVGEDELVKLDTKLTEKFQPQYQTAFETKYLEEITYGDTTFEEATEEFKESKEAKLLQEKYEEEYGKEYKKISQSASLGKKLAGGGAMEVLKITQFGMELIKTPKQTIVTTGAVATGTKLLQAIPSWMGVTVSTGLFAYGTYKALSPLSTVEEAGGGIITATLMGATLGFSAIKYLKSPVIKTINIKPKISTKTGKIIGYEQPKVVIKDIYGKTIIKEITKYPNTLSRQVISGRRTIVTTKGRQLLKMEDIYKGIPTQQLGKTYITKSVRDTYIYKTSSAYQKALKKLTKYGYTEAQAKTTLRYYSPKIIETKVSGINILTYGEKIKPYAVAKTTVIKKQPIKFIDEELGIKTRGARSIKEVYTSEKSIIKELKEYTLIKEISTKTTGFLTEKGGWYNKLTQAGKTSTQYERTILAKVSKIKTGYLPREISKYYVAGQKYRYQTLKEIFAQRQIVPLKYQKLFGKVEAKLIKTKDVIYLDESKLTGIKVRETYTPKKAPKVRAIEDMSAKELKLMIRDLQDIYGKGSPIKKVSRIIPPTKDVEKVIAKLDEEIGISGIRLKTLDKYYGKGIYERTEGGLTPQNLDQALKTDILKQIQMPDLKTKFTIKDLIKIKQVDKLGLGLATATGTKLLLDLKIDNLLKVDPKSKMALKNLLKTDMALKQQPALKQSPALKQILKLKLGLTPIAITPTMFETPIIPKIKIPSFTTPIIPPFLLKGRIEKKLLKKKKKKGRELAYLPDFTARALGLDPDVITGKQAQAKIKKILTGLEIRKGVIIK